MYVMGSDRVCHGRWLFNQIRGYSIDGETLAFESGRRAVNGEVCLILRDASSFQPHWLAQPLQLAVVPSLAQFMGVRLRLSWGHCEFLCQSRPEMSCALQLCCQISIGTWRDSAGVGHVGGPQRSLCDGTRGLQGHYAIKSFWAAEIYAYFDELEEMLVSFTVFFFSFAFAPFSLCSVGCCERG